MLAADIERFRETLHQKDTASLIEIAVEYFVKQSDLETRLSMQEDISKEMILQYDEMKRRVLSLEKENEELRKQNIYLTGVKTRQAQEMFGKSSEKIENLIVEATSSTEYVDPLSEDIDEKQAGLSADKKTSHGKIISFEKLTGLDKKKKKRGRRKLDLSALPRCSKYDYDFEKYDQMYGKGNWRIYGWEKKETIELIRRTTYVQETYEPIISYGLEHMMDRIPFEGRIIHKSKVSASLLSQIICDYGNLHVPAYRLEHDTERYGFKLSRQTMISWMMYVAHNLFKPVFDRCKYHLKRCPYQHCDETPYNVLKESTHNVNYIWAHRTGELADVNPIIMYFFEISRDASHLLDFYNDLSMTINLSCDSYSSYHTLEGELPEFIQLCGCLMHVRRRFVDALRTYKDFDESIIENLPEMKAIRLLGNLYAIEEECKGLSATERYEKRQLFAKPKMNEFFDFIKSLDENDPTYNDKMKDAIKYSKNQEVYLRRYLEDGNIPPDNGACERTIKSIACHRKNSLFSCSIEGAQATMIIMSLMETAKANEAIPFYYFKYLLEEMSKVVIYGHSNDIEDMMPWSEAYRKYETDQQQQVIASGAPPSEMKPEKPGCRRKAAS